MSRTEGTFDITPDHQGDMSAEPHRTDGHSQLQALSLADSSGAATLGDNSQLTLASHQQSRVDKSVAKQPPPLDFSLATSKDPVLEAIFSMIDRATKNKTRVADYIKLSFFKLACVRDFKASNITDADLSTELGNMHLGIPSLPLNAAGTGVKAAIREMHELSISHSHTLSAARKQLAELINTCGRNIPKVYDEHWMDDLCQAYYSIVSDSYYPATDIVTPNGYNSVKDSLQVHVITHIHLIGGKPAALTVLDVPITCSLDTFRQKVRFSRLPAIRRQSGRLGSDINESLEDSRWLYATADTLVDLNAKEHVHWVGLTSSTFDEMKAVKGESIFVIHSSQETIPASIALKAAEAKTPWNKWYSVTEERHKDGTSLRFPPPEFLPGPKANLRRDLVFMVGKKGSARSKDEAFERLERRVVGRDS